MLRLAFIGMVAGLQATAAVAMTPLAQCNSGAGGAEQHLLGYNVTTVGGGFVYYETSETATGVNVRILEYCPSRRQLTLRLPQSGGDRAMLAAAEAMLNEMVFGPKVYTQGQMARRLRDLGADAVVRAVEYESCACDMAGAA